MPSFVAVDLNFDHLAAVLVDCWGNPVGRMTLQFPDAGMDEGKALVTIGDAVRSLCLLAKSRNDGIAIEKRMGASNTVRTDFSGGVADHQVAPRRAR